MPAFTDLVVTLAADPRVRGRQFEHICRWYLMNDPQYRTALRHVWLWDDWPGRWSADAGIDLVAEDHSGRLWAIQAKAYAPQYTVTKADVDTFLAESSRAVFSYRLLIATTDKLSPNGRRTIDAQEKAIGLVGLSDLLTADVNWPANPGRLRPSPPPKPAKPRDYQREAIDAVVTGFDTAERGQMIMACGTGKTLTAQFIAQELDAQRTLVLVPSLSLLKQTMRGWQTQGRRGVEALPVCSDETVSRTEDIPVEHVSELGLPVTTDPAEIAAFLRKRSGPRVVFSTYQSSPQIAAAYALGRVPALDLVIADEAHRVAGKVDTAFGTVLDAKAIRSRRRLFMTATPRYFTGRVLNAAKDADLEVASMDDHTKFGEVFHRLSFGAAIKRDLLTDYQVVVIGVSSEEYRTWTDKGTLLSRDGKTTDARTLASQIGLAKAMRRYDLHRMISFHSRVSRAREFAAELPEVIDWMAAMQRPKGSLWTDFASGEMTAGERHVRLQHLGRLGDGKRGLLANARCLSEGVDVPTLDGVAFIDPRRSEVDIVQAVGRAIRKADDKTVGTIVIPVFIDTDEDPATALDASDFKPVWNVIKALRAHDQELAEKIDSLRREMGRRSGPPKIPDKIHLDLPVSVDTVFADVFDVRLVEQTSARWEFWYGLLERYVEEHGTARVPTDYIADSYRLGQWTSVQRSLYSRTALSADRSARLERLHGWVWDLLADQWSVWMSLMRDFVSEHGHANVPFPYKVDGYNLRGWVATQRGLHKRGELSDGRVGELEALPGWVWDAVDDYWARHYQNLEGFAHRTGHARPSAGYIEGGLRLGQWVAVQRRYRDDMAPERRALLQALPGWSWNPKTDGWQRAYEALTVFVEQEGHARVPNSHKENGVNLGKWVTQQRSRRDSLTDEQCERLESLDGWTWDARTDMWNRKLAVLRQFQRREGHALVPQGYVEGGVKLGTWVLEQRNGEQRMSDERRALLESVPGWSWNPYSESWERAYAALVSFVELTGHARVPKKLLVGGINLGGWVAEQRGNRSMMTGERRQRLEALPGWSWNATEDTWMKHLALLHGYADREGNTQVPADYVEDGLKLGQWVRLRRKEHKKLSTERQALLEAVPGWFWGTKSERTWEQRYEMVEQFARREGHSRVPSTYVEGDVRLGGWVAEQRTTRDNMSAERVTRLEALDGWAWSASDAAWDEKYELLCGYVHRTGTAKVPQGHFENEVALGSWVAVQRQRQKNGVLKPDRRDRLAALTGWIW